MLKNWKDQIHIELVDYMGTDTSVSNAARVSFNKWKDTLQADGADTKLIRYLAEHKHMTPFRHTQVQLRCKTSLPIARQLMKHQAGLSWNEISRRYVDSPMELFNQEFRVRARSVKQGSGSVIAEEDIPWVKVGTDLVPPSQLMSHLLSWYDSCIEDGIAPETVRGYMPQNMMTEWIWSGNLLSFAHLYNLRSDSHAQVEVQHFAKLLDEVVRPLFPVAWGALTGLTEDELEETV